MLNILQAHVVISQQHIHIMQNYSQTNFNRTNVQIVLLGCINLFQSHWQHRRIVFSERLPVLYHSILLSLTILNKHILLEFSFIILAFCSLILPSSILKIIPVKLAHCYFCLMHISFMPILVFYVTIFYMVHLCLTQHIKNTFVANYTT